MKNHVGRLFLYCLLAYRAVDARATRGSNSRRRIGVFEENDFFVPAKTAKVKNNDTAPKNATKAPSKVVTKAPTTLKGQESKQLPKTVEPTTTFSPSKGRIKKKTKAEGSKSGTMAGKSLKKVNKGMGGKKTGKNAGGESFSPTSLTTQPPTAPTTGPPFHTPTEPPASGPSSVSLSPYSLMYSIAQTTIPLVTEVDQVVTTTADFLTSYMESNLVGLSSFVTSSTSNHFRFGQPYEIDYFSEASFSSGTVPTQAELDALLQTAFSGTNLVDYIGLLQNLPNNIFNTVSNVQLSQQTGTSNAKSGGNQAPSTAPFNTSTGRSSSDSNGANAGLIAASVAGGILVLVFGVLFYNNKQGEHTHLLSPDEKGHMTIADDTFEGTSTIYPDSSDETGMRFRDAQSITRSDWGLSTQAISEEGSHASQRSSVELDRIDEHTSEGSIGFTEMLRNREMSVEYDDHDNHVPSQTDVEAMPLARAFPSCNALKIPDEDQIDTHLDVGSESEDEEVPVRVVDLIKIFSRA